MSEFGQTQVSNIKVRSNPLLFDAREPIPEAKWIETATKRPADRFLKNLAVASALVLCAATLRTGAIPPLNETSDVVLTVATDQSLLDDQLGKLSFVSSLFPEAVLVFGEVDAELTMPVSGGVLVHAWSEAEPYMSWNTNSRQVNSSADGEVIGVYHGNGDERLIQVMGNNGVSVLYGNLADVNVETGDMVFGGDKLGTLLADKEFYMEVRRDGRSVDPSLYLSR